MIVLSFRVLVFALLVLLVSAQFASAINVNELDGASGFKIVGVADGDWAGNSVSDAGDLNGDGIDDFIIGAVRASPDGRQLAGESYVVFGESGIGSSGLIQLGDLDGSNGFTIPGIAQEDFSGYSVSRAGDINGDQYSDLIIGAALAGTSGAPDTGQAYVIFGGPNIGMDGSFSLSGLNGDNGFALHGISSNDFAGRTVANAGDFNGDGTDDLLVTASLADQSEFTMAGEAYVVFGGAQLGSNGSFELASLDGSNGFKIEGRLTDAHTGYSGSGIGDFNNDGFDDIALGAPVLGEAYVLFGSNSTGSLGSIKVDDLTGANGFIVNGTIGASGRLGNSVSGAGDINGDGFDDVVIGDSTYSDGLDAFRTGEAYVIFGSSTTGSTGSIPINDLDGENGFRIRGINNRDEAATSVSLSGDFNHDGYQDLVIGSPLADPGSVRSDHGETYVVFGGADIGGEGVFDLDQIDETNGYIVRGTDFSEKVGTSVTSAGDINHDGIDDLLIGAIFARLSDTDATGGAYVIFGERALPTISGDFNSDGIVNAADYTLWRDSLNSSGDLPGDGNLDGVVNFADYNVWRNTFGVSSSANIPEPASLLIALSVAVFVRACRIT